MLTFTAKQAKEMLDQNPTKSDPKDALLIARLTSEGKYVKPIDKRDKQTFSNIIHNVSKNTSTYAKKNY